MQHHNSRKLSFGEFELGFVNQILLQETEKVASFVTESLAEVLHEVELRFGVALEAIQDRGTLGRNVSCLPLSNLTARPVDQLQVVVQRPFWSRGSSLTSCPL